ncbi:MAG: DUF5131 family protein [Mesorhizobium sp.]|nr:MAG: DUF5131 family protein [Mesorhizobium sp.]
MGATTGIAWTDSTFNSWWGCTKVGPACDDCYAEGVDKRTGENHWGHGAPRRLLSEHARYEPYRWQKNADKFFAEHGRKRRVFTLSMGDLFDNEVPDRWRAEHFQTMETCDRLHWQICTKRGPQIRKMVPEHWCTGHWPRHVGVLITVVTQAEADRDVPRLMEVKKDFNIPWTGVSYEPAQEGIDFTNHLFGPDGLDWVIFGGKSGPKWNDRPFSVEWGAVAARQCALASKAFFFKQVAAFRPTDAMIPEDLRIRQFPGALL